MAAIVMDHAGRSCGETILPTDILFEILLKLPVKTLCKFRFVSKSWFSLISDPIFIISHYNVSQQNPLLLMQLSTYASSGLYSLNLEDGTVIPKHSVQKMLAETKTSTAYTGATYTVSTHLDLVCMYNKKDVWICNPSTEELIMLPTRESKPPLFRTSVSFGYVHSTGEYKVLSHCYRSPIEQGDHYFPWCEIFTLGRTDGNSSNGHWRTVENSPMENCFIRDVPTDEGAMYLALDYEGIPDESYEMGIPRFDFEHEEWSDVLPPPIVTDYPPGLVLEQIGRRLCMVDLEYPSYRMHLWFLKDYKRSVWVKEYSVDVSMLSPPTQESIHIVPLANNARDGRFLLEVYDLNDLNRGLYWLNPNDQSYEKLSTGEHYSKSFYVESFTSLGKGSSSPAITRLWETTEQ